jgi:lantibiotic modifying enzyme
MRGNMNAKRILIAIVTVMVLLGTCLAGDQPYLDAALGAARWIQASAITTESGVVWPTDPLDLKSVNTGLYSGTPGPILFFLELYRYTGNASYLKAAREGADALLASVSTDEGTGLYAGVAGTGFTLGEMYLVTHERKYREGVLRCVQLLKDRSKNVGRGVQWSNTIDIISGNAGTGLFLLWADKELKAPGARELAVAAGQRLIEVGQRLDSDKLKWMMDPAYPRELPNFSHGTAGVSYFLATLYQQTKQKEFLDAAMKGTNYLLSIADQEQKMCRIYHNDTPDGKTLYYLGWCHGPAGTARLFYRLYQITKDPVWMGWVKKAGRAVVASGGPERVVTPGEWNNVSMCCGISSEAEFFLALYKETRDQEFLELSKKATALLLSKATRDDKGVRWIQAEHRVKPELLVAQTGYMQGASGIGMWLLHMNAFTEKSTKTAIVFPDNPFAY